MRLSFCRISFKRRSNLGFQKSLYFLHFYTAQLLTTTTPKTMNSNISEINDVKPFGPSINDEAEEQCGIVGRFIATAVPLGTQKSVALLSCVSRDRVYEIRHAVRYEPMVHDDDVNDHFGFICPKPFCLTRFSTTDDMMRHYQSCVMCVHPNCGAHPTSSNIPRDWLTNHHAACPFLLLDALRCNVFATGFSTPRRHDTMKQLLKDFSTDIESNFEANACITAALSDEQLSPLLRPSVEGTSAVAVAWFPDLPTSRAGAKAYKDAEKAKVPRPRVSHVAKSKVKATPKTTPKTTSKATPKSQKNFTPPSDPSDSESDSDTESEDEDDTRMHSSSPPPKMVPTNIRPSPPPTQVFMATPVVRRAAEDDLAPAAPKRVRIDQDTQSMATTTATTTTTSTAAAAAAISPLAKQALPSTKRPVVWRQFDVVNPNSSHSPLPALVPKTQQVQPQQQPPQHPPTLHQYLYQSKNAKPVFSRPDQQQQYEWITTPMSVSAPVSEPVSVLGTTSASTSTSTSQSVMDRIDLLSKNMEKTIMIVDKLTTAVNKIAQQGASPMSMDALVSTSPEYDP